MRDRFTLASLVSLALGLVGVFSIGRVIDTLLFVRGRRFLPKAE